MSRTYHRLNKAARYEIAEAQIEDLERQLYGQELNLARLQALPASEEVARAIAVSEGILLAIESGITTTLEEAEKLN